VYVVIGRQSVRPSSSCAVEALTWRKAAVSWVVIRGGVSTAAGCCNRKAQDPLSRAGRCTAWDPGHCICSLGG
jgi:hypothetical protein